MSDVMMPTAFQNMKHPDDIALYIGMRILYGVPDASLRSQVNDLVETLTGEKAFHPASIREIKPTHLKIGIVVEYRRARFLERRIVVVIEIVHANDRVATIEQGFCCEEANKAGRACNEYFHAWMISPRCTLSYHKQRSFLVTEIAARGVTECPYVDDTQREAWDSPASASEPRS